jgi:hypothetical protein
MLEQKAKAFLCLMSAQPRRKKQGKKVAKKPREKRAILFTIQSDKHTKKAQS